MKIGYVDILVISIGKIALSAAAVNDCGIFGLQRFFISIVFKYSSARQKLKKDERVEIT